MRLDIGATVHGNSGKLGTLERVIINPDDNEITHLIVRKGWLLTRDVVVRASRVSEYGPDGVHLDLSDDDLEELPDYRVTEYREPDVGWKPPVPFPAGGVLWAGASPTAPPIPEHVYRNVPETDVEIREGMDVECTDGKIGTVDKLFVDGEGKVTAIEVSAGLLFPSSKTVPMGPDVRIDGERILLPCAKDEMDQVAGDR